MSMIFNLKPKLERGHIAGACAKCGKAVWESLFILDDCYNVYAGRCPHCGAINLLALTGLRGYSSAGMDLVLPYDEERDANQLPADCPTQGPKGEPATVHGSNLGELMHALREEDALPRKEGKRHGSPEADPETSSTRNRERSGVSEEAE